MHLVVDVCAGRQRRGVASKVLEESEQDAHLLVGFRGRIPDFRDGSSRGAVPGCVALDEVVNLAVKLSPISAALEFEMLSSSGWLGESSPRGSKRHPEEGMESFEIVARGLKDSLPRGHTVPLLVSRSSAGFWDPGRDSSHQVPSTPV